MRGMRHDYVFRSGDDDQRIRQGGTFEIAFVPYEVQPTRDEDGNLISPGTVSDLTGMTFRGAFRGDDEDGPMQASLPESAWTIELRAWGVYGLLQTVVGTLSATATAAMTAREGVYDVEAVQGGVVREMLYGSYVLAREVTK